MTLILELKEKEKLRNLRLAGGLLVLVSSILITCLLTFLPASADEIVVVAEKKLKKKPERTHDLHLEVFPTRQVKESLFLSGLVTKLSRHGAPPRPDTKETFHYFDFPDAPFTKLKHGERIYLRFDGKELVQSQEKTPLTLAFSDDGQKGELLVSITSEEGGALLSERCQFAMRDIPLSKESYKEPSFQTFCESLSTLRVYQPDLFFQKYGGKKLKAKGTDFRLGSSFSQVYCVKDGDVFTLQMGELVPISNPENATCPLFRVKEVQRSGVQLEAWDTSGKEYATITISPEPTKQMAVRAEDLFKDVRIKGKGRAVVKVGKKTKILSAGDYLLNEKDKWTLVDKKDTLDKLINYLQSGILFVFEGFVKQGSTTLFVGTLFDETRSVSKRVEIPLQTKQKVQRNQNRGMRRADHESRAMPPSESIPPELEDLFDELDDL